MLCLPAAHPLAAELGAAAGQQVPLRVGIVNLMPSAEAYEAMLLEPLARAPRLVQPIWLRLRSHGYASSDAAHLDRFYRQAAQLTAPLDGLIVTGAPVEELPYEQVRYYAELAGLVRGAEVPTLGLCWGGMLLAKLLGVEKRVVTPKLFGLYALRDGGDELCAQSRHAGLDEAQLARVPRLRVLATSASTGATVLEDVQLGWQLHLGHPEYTPARLWLEYDRDRALGRSDVQAPAGLSERDRRATPLPHGYKFFASWLELVATRRAG